MGRMSGMTAIRLILGDQLSRDISSLDGLDPARDIILMAEVGDETTYVKHHKQKIALILSAMRHFAADLSQEGLRVDYVTLDNPNNTGSFTGELERAITRHHATRVVVTEPGEWRVLEMMRAWSNTFDIPVEIREDRRFIASRSRFARWAEGKKALRMEFFYREMRRETGLLMDGDTPEGGEWNFDSENRKALPKNFRAPNRLRFEPDDLTRSVIRLVEKTCSDHFGDLDNFAWPVTRKDALQALDHFITECLPTFGDYQDAMKIGAPFLSHALLAPALNIGLLNPVEICIAAERAYKKGKAPLNAVEGFIRQIIGWREYIRGIYWHVMPDYPHSNALDAKRPLPEFFWTGKTPMRCLSETITDTKRNAYAHHIQRLMITGNFALLAGLDPRQVEEWYLAVYADAFEWVELPNTHGMALYADGGIVGSKPYAASGAYINRMSDYCSGCGFNPKEKDGAKACPFNLLYWDFLGRHEDKFRNNPRMAMPIKNLLNMPKDKRADLERRSKYLLDHLDDLAAEQPNLL